MNGAYWTAGLELASERIQLQMAYYAEDVSLTTTPEDDRRFVFKAAYRF